jgi:hypothetical protein
VHTICHHATTARWAACTTPVAALPSHNTLKHSKLPRPPTAANHMHTQHGSAGAPLDQSQKPTTFRQRLPHYVHTHLFLQWQLAALHTPLHNLLFALLAKILGTQFNPLPPWATTCQV